VTALVLRQGAVLAGLGLASGLVFAAIAARFLEGQLFAVSSRDFVSYVSAASAIAAAALTACWLPARRASAASPLDAIRAE
jgi:putative ABC transport system permease protein